MYTVYILQRNIRFCPYIKHVKNAVATTERKQTNKYYNNLQNKYQWRANKTSDQTIILYCNFMIQYPFSFVCIDTWVVCFHWITKQSYRKLLKEKLDNSWDPIWFDWHVFGRNCKSSRMVFCCYHSVSWRSPTWTVRFPYYIFLQYVQIRITW